MIEFLGYVRDFFAIIGFLSFLGVVVVAIAMPKADDDVRRGRRPW